MSHEVSFERVLLALDKTSRALNDFVRLYGADEQDEESIHLVSEICRLLGRPLPWEIGENDAEDDELMLPELCASVVVSARDGLLSDSLIAAVAARGWQCVDGVIGQSPSILSFALTLPLLGTDEVSLLRRCAEETQALAFIVSRELEVFGFAHSACEADFIVLDRASA